MSKDTPALVTSYVNPDLDGTACAIAYAEFLVKNGTDAAAGIFGEPQHEVEFVVKTFTVPVPRITQGAVANFTHVILVDSCKIRNLPPDITPEMVREIIDHHKDNDATLFPNATIQIELVGAAATLITERFIKNNCVISKESAGLLYSGIISNTINLRANLTTDRDRTMAQWLKERIELPENYIHDFFRHKSEFTQPLKKIFEDDLVVRRHGDYIGAIAQLEIVNLANFVARNLSEIQQALREIKQKESVDFIFFSGIDLEKAFNQFVFIDEETKNLVAQALGETFTSDTPRREGILMRKEIGPRVGDILKNRP